MPLIVDHDARRREVGAIAARLIATSGLEGVTVRDVARIAGFSTAVVSHYFDNKRALLPLDRDRRDRWKIWFAFWGMAMEDAAFLAEQQQRGREARLLIVELLETASDIPAFSAEERDMQARRLLVAVTGLSGQATYDPVDWPRARQRALLGMEIAALRG